MSLRCFFILSICSYFVFFFFFFQAEDGIRDLTVTGVQTCALPIYFRQLAWVSGWRKLPHITREVEKLFDYPQQFAEDVFGRIEHALRRRVLDGEAGAAVRTGHLLIRSEDDPHADSTTSLIPELPVRYVASSDMQMVAAHKAEFCDQPRLFSDRREGKCLDRKSVV